MSQTSIIFGTLLIGFIVYITIKGELPAYAAVLWGPKPATGTVTTTFPNGAIPTLSPIPSLGNTMSMFGTTTQGGGFL